MTAQYKAPANARAEARKAGAKTYRGVPCTHGHDGTRYTNSTKCVYCRRVRAVVGHKVLTPGKRRRYAGWPAHFPRLEPENLTMKPMPTVFAVVLPT